MHEHIQTRTNMQMAQLQRPRQRDNHRRIHLAQRTLPIRMVFRALRIFFDKGAGGQGFGGDATGQRRVVVDVELEQVEEGVVDEVQGAVDVLFHAEEEFEGAAGFVAGEGGDVGELARGVGDVFARVAVILVRVARQGCG